MTSKEDLDNSFDIPFVNILYHFIQSKLKNLTNCYSYFFFKNLYLALIWQKGHAPKVKEKGGGEELFKLLNKISCVPKDIVYRKTPFFFFLSNFFYKKK